MEHKTIKQNSLGVRLASVYGGYNLHWRGTQTDICTLRKHMLIGVLQIVFFSLCGVIVCDAMDLDDLLAWLVYMGVHTQYVEPSHSTKGLLFGIAFLLCAGLGTALGVGAIRGVRLYRYRTAEARIAEYERDAERRRNAQSKEPSLFMLAYKSWKEKLCYPVTIEK